MPTPPLPEQPGRVPVPTRDAAWTDYYRRNDLDQFNAYHRAVIEAAFAAGWKANNFVNQEPAKLDTGSLFPTVGVGDVH